MKSRVKKWDKTELQVSYKTNFLEQLLCFLSTTFLHRGYEQCWLCNSSYAFPTMRRPMSQQLANREERKVSSYLGFNKIPYQEESPALVTEKTKGFNSHKSNVNWPLNAGLKPLRTEFLVFIFFFRSHLNSIRVTPEEQR